MSKLSFRARALDAGKPLPIYRAEEIGDSGDCSLINRAVPQMPTGMEKEEEAEHHLQQAISTRGTVIPTPEVFIVDDECYNKYYPDDYKLPRQLIYMQPFSMENDIPDYDMDSEDEQWVGQGQGRGVEVTPEKFEEMMDRLEKGSGQTAVTLQEAKALIKEDDDLIIAVYDYWLNKRLKLLHPLIPTVKTEAKHGVANHNPYIAFRRRTEKMQTRKNRKNDESSYEKMLKLRRDLTRAVNLLEMVKKREKSKRELLHLTIEVFEKRTQAQDYSGHIVQEALNQRPARPAFTPLFQPNSLNWVKDELNSLNRKEKRQYNKKRMRHKSKSHHGSSYHHHRYLNADGESSEDDLLVGGGSSPDGLHHHEVEEDEGLYAFKRKKDCEYQAPLDTSDGSSVYTPTEIEERLKFYPASISERSNSSSSRSYRGVGPCRRRMGRGGRILLDRMTIQELRELCRVMGYYKPPSPMEPSPSSSFMSRASSSQDTSQSATSSSLLRMNQSTQGYTTTLPQVQNIKQEVDVDDNPTASSSSSILIPPIQIKEEDPSDEYKFVSPAAVPSQFIKQEFSPTRIIKEEDVSLSPPRLPEDYSNEVELGCFHHFLPPTPDPIDTGEWLMISEPSSVEESIEEPATPLLTASDPLLDPSYHLGLIVSNQDRRPVTWELGTLLGDPLIREPSVEVPSSKVVLDQETSEEQNTYYLMNNEDDEVNSWSSIDVNQQPIEMEVDLGVTTDINKDTRPPSGPGPTIPPESSDHQNPPHQNGTSDPSSSPQPTAAVLSVKSGEETEGKDSSRELNRFALLISV